MERSLTYKDKNVDQPFHVPLIYTYGTGANEIKNYIDKSVNNVLVTAPIFKDCKKPILKTVYKKSASLGNMLFNQKKIVLRSDSGGKSIRCTSEEESKRKRGPKCQTCPNMSNSNTFKVNGITYNKCDGGNCKSNNVIYLAICKICNLAYFGKTTTPLHERLNNHRNSLNGFDYAKEPITDKQTLAYHALVHHQSQNFNNTYTYFIVKNVNNPDDLLSYEQFFINKFKTKKPTGLNSDNPVGVRVLRIT